jgi:hypothetical protein
MNGAESMRILLLSQFYPPVIGGEAASSSPVVARQPNVKEFSPPPRGHRGIGSETDRTGGPPNSVLFDVDSRHIGSFRFHLEHPACE